MSRKPKNHGLPSLPSIPPEVKQAAQRRKSLLYSSALLAADDDEQREIRRELDSIRETLHLEMLERLKAVCDHYGLDFNDPHCLPSLAMQLARDCISRFDVYSTSRPGRPTGRGMPTGISLVLAVQEIDAERGRGVSDACNRLSKKDGPWKGRSKKVLEVRYYEAKAEKQFLQRLKAKRGTTESTN